MPILPIRDLGKTGIITDTPAYNLKPNEIDQAFNIRYENNVPTRSLGWSRLETYYSLLGPTYKPLAASEVLNSNQNGLIIILGNSTNVRKVPKEGSIETTIERPNLRTIQELKFAYFDGTPQSPSPPANITGELKKTEYFDIDISNLYGATFINLQIGAPLVYGEADTFIRELEHWYSDIAPDASCDIFTNYKNFYIALNMKENGIHEGNKIRWSNIVEPPITPGTRNSMEFSCYKADTQPLNLKGFVIYVETAPINFYYHVAGLPDTPPNVQAEPLFKIEITTTMSAIELATATAIAMDNTPYFTATNNGNLVNYINVNYGEDKKPDFGETVVVDKSWVSVYMSANPTYYKAREILKGTYGSDPRWIDNDPIYLSGYLYLPDDYDAIIAAKRLADKLIVYTLQSTYYMSYTGGSYIFSINKLFEDDGAISREAVVEFDNKHFVVSRQDVYVHDGNSKESIIEGKIKKAFFNTATDLTKIKLFKFTRKKEIWILFAESVEAKSGDYLDRAWVYNYNYKTWTLVEIPDVKMISNGPRLDALVSDYDHAEETYDGYTKTYSEVTRKKITPSFYYISYQQNDIYLGDDTTKHNGADFQSFITRDKIDLDELFGSTYPIKYVKQILPLITGDGEVDFTFQISNGPNQNQIPYQNKKFLLDNQERYKIDTRFSGRYLSYTIAMNTTVDKLNGTFAVYGMDINMEPRGTR